MPLESPYFNQTCIELSTGFTNALHSYKKIVLKAAIMFIHLCSFLLLRPRGVQGRGCKDTEFRQDDVRDDDKRN